MSWGKWGFSVTRRSLYAQLHVLCHCIFDWESPTFGCLPARISYAQESASSVLYIVFQLSVGCRQVLTDQGLSWRRRSPWEQNWWESPLCFCSQGETCVNIQLIPMGYRSLRVNLNAPFMGPGPGWLLQLFKKLLVKQKIKRRAESGLNILHLVSPREACSSLKKNI